MSITGDFGKLAELGARLDELEGVGERVAARAAEELQPVVYEYFAPGAGHGFAPAVAVSARGADIVVDEGSPARLPEGVPLPDGAEAIVSRIAEDEIAKALGGGS